MNFKYLPYSYSNVLYFKLYDINVCDYYNIAWIACSAGSLLFLSGIWWSRKACRHHNLANNCIVGMFSLKFPLLLIPVTSLVLQVTSRTLYITPDDYHSTNNSNISPYHNVSVMVKCTLLLMLTWFSCQDYKTCKKILFYKMQTTL